MYFIYSKVGKIAITSKFYTSFTPSAKISLTTIKSSTIPFQQYFAVYLLLSGYLSPTKGAGKFVRNSKFLG